MSGLKIFFAAQQYMTNLIEETLQTLNMERLDNLFSILIDARNGHHNIIVDGMGRSLQSILLTEDCLEHNGFPIILPAANASLRPWKPGDVFIFNSGSASGSPVAHAAAAMKDGLKVLGMTFNKSAADDFPDVIVLEPSQTKNPVYAPLGTEFEFTSAVLGSAIGYSVKDTTEDSIAEFNIASQQMLATFKTTKGYFEERLEPLMKFINIISEYLCESKNHVYFRGVGRDLIINSVASIRYGHLRKEPDCDLKVISEGHWDIRKSGDLAILSSGSGSTAQTLDYAMQAFISGMRVFGITSFEDSDLGRFTNRCDGCLVIPGRKTMFSMYNMVPNPQTTDFLPEFELNTYLTLDSLLAQIASNHGITEDDMKASHKLKVLE